MPRARLARPLTLHGSGWETTVETLNVSPGGCALLLDTPPPKGPLHFALKLRPDLVATGTARTVNVIEYGGRFYVSLAFARLESVDRQQLIDAVLEALS